MKFLVDNRFLRITEKAFDFFLLNLIWLIMCLPIITIFPSTTAMYGVARKWIMGRNEEGVIRMYFSIFRECFWNSIALSVIWFTLGIFIYWDFHLIKANVLLLIILGILTLIFLSITVFLFPVLVQFETNWKNIIRNALTLAITYPLSTILLLAIFLLSVYLVYLFPAVIFILGSMVAYISYRICHQLFTNR
jgi:uncharacterized membrane protein YesL